LGITYEPNAGQENDGATVWLRKNVTSNHVGYDLSD